MTRALLFALAVSVAATAQTPSLPLPGAEPALPLPGAAAEQPKKTKKSKAKDEPLPLPGAAPALPLPSADAKQAPALPLPDAKKDVPALPLPAAEAKKAPPPLTLPAAPKQETAQKAEPLKNAPTQPSQAAQASTAAAPKAPQADKAQPAAPMAARGPDLRLHAPASDHDLWNVRALLGAERSSEGTYTEPVSLSRIGVEATRWFSTSWLARAELDYRGSRQPYVPLHAAANRSVLVDENRFDVVAGIGYDVGSLLLKSGRLELTPMLGVHYMGIRNDAFPSDLIGANVTGRARFALSSAVLVHGTLGYTYNFAVAKTQNSALKSPLSDMNLRAGLQLPLAGNYALELDYTGDFLSFENTYRVAHGAALGFGSTF